MKDVVLPNDADIERSVIGTLLTRGDYDEVRDVLTEECFYQARYREIFKVILRLLNRGDEVSILTVQPELNVSEISPADLAEISSYCILTNFRRYAEILRELMHRRRLYYLAQELYSKSISNVEIPIIIELLRKNIDDIQGEESTTAIDLRGGMQIIHDLITSNTNGAMAEQGTMTGFDYLDKKGGLHPSDLIVIAGESSHGKTSLATSMALNAVMNGSRIAFYSMEMTATQIMARMTAIRSGVSANHILYNPLNAGELQKVDAAVGGIMNAEGNVFVDDRSTSNIDTIISSIRTNKLRNNIEGAVVDYLQILNVNMRNTNKEQAMADVARRLKNLAKDLGIWIIALSQLNRADGESNINRLRDSGQIAEAADVVMLVYRPEKNGVARYNAPYEDISIKGTALIDVAKGRNIGVGKFICGFDAAVTHFYDLRELPKAKDEKKESKLPF